jgi:radical SAM superfamily enzyme YgiQ (UPF0313 family)
MRVLLVYPRNPEAFWSFEHVLPFVSKKAAFQPLGLLTLAAMLPQEWEFELVDLNVERLRDSHIERADYVMISAMIIHKESVHAIVKRCRAMGKPIIAGGPLFTTGHEGFPDIDHFVLGEAEDAIPTLVADMERGTLQHVYRGSERPEITRVPIPRWDLIRLRNYATMSVQFSRGCPYDCEFCDIIVMNGRVPRTKTPEQFVAELDSLRTAGWRETVFIVDDNFIGNKKCTKALLREIIAWRERVKPEMAFFTEATVNLADDREMLELMTRAGFKKVFLGIETPSIESLKECHKLQNTRRDLIESVKTIQRAGMEAMAGFIVGFDNDRDDIFHRQFEFIQRSGVVTAMVGLLTALPQTALYKRLMREGRIESEATGNNTQAVLNFTPKLDREFLINGYRELMNKLYEPKVYYRRIRTFLENHRPSGPKLPLMASDVKALFRTFWALGIRHRGRIAFWDLILRTLFGRPRQFRHAIELSLVGYHFRRVARSL